MKKSIVVVGAGKGLGNGVAEKFGENGFRVILMARSESHLKEYETYFSSKGIEVYTQAADVGDFKNFSEAFNNIVKKHGMPDVLFYNVGITAHVEIGKVTAETLVNHYAVDVASCYNCIKLVENEEFKEERSHSNHRRRSCYSSLCRLFTTLYG